MKRLGLAGLCLAWVATPTLWAASIAGIVRDENSATAIPAQLELFDREGQRRALVNTPNGTFTLPDLSAGRYYLKASAAGHIAESYPDLRCFIDECDVRFGQPFELTATSTVTGLEINLAPHATLRISTLDADTRTPIFPDLFVVDAANGQVLNPFHDHPYVAEYFAMAPGAYYVATVAAGYAMEGADGQHLASRDLADVIRALPVVLLGGEVRDLELELDRLGQVTGSTDAPFCTLTAFAGTGNTPSATTTCAADGSYQLALPPGPHQLLVQAEGRGARFIGNIPCYVDDAGRPRCRREVVTSFEVALGGTASLPHLALPPAGTLQGTVALPTGVAGSTQLRLYDASAYPVLTRTLAPTTAPQSFELTGLAPGLYFLEAIGPSPAGRQVFAAQDCLPTTCKPLEGTPIAVNAGQTTTGIALVLPLAPGLCPGSDLCLEDGRFAITAAWRDPAGQVGVGVGQAITDDTGSLYFFSPANIELVVKVLDACYPPFERYWVFAAGLTNVEVELTATDTLTGQSRVYFNPAGQAFAAIQDTDAFPCGAPGALTSAPLATPAATPAAGPPPARFAPPVLPSFCIPSSAESLCLLSQRFRAEATWQTTEGQGPATASPLTADTGNFWFFSPDNLEITLKVLDGCALNGHYWVFGAGLTNVGVTLSVTDTTTDRTLTYTNPVGQAFRPILDTQAFTCWR